MIDKIILPHRYPSEPNVALVTDQAGLMKTAFSTNGPLRDFMANFKHKPDCGYILAVAMSAYECAGFNNNGDGFMTSMLVPSKMDPRRPFGYTTFETAKVYRHHNNKPNSPSFGTIPKAFWNPVVQRVEVLLELPVNLNTKELADAEAGKDVAFSMGCFLAGTMVTMADGTRKPIEAVAVGDRVITHKGRPRKVTEVHARPYEGPIYGVKCPSHHEVWATKEHPFLAVSEDSVRSSARAVPRWKDEMEAVPDWVHAACLDAHVLIEPIVSEIITPDYATKEFARLLGYYVAEGHIVWNKKKEPIGIWLTVNEADAVNDEIEALCLALKTDNPPVTTNYAAKRCESVRQIQIYDRSVAELCLRLGGTGAKNKAFAEEVLYWDPEIQKELVGAYINGDGCASGSGLSISTASEKLAAQLMAIIPRFGVIAAWQAIHHKPSSLVKVSTVEQVIYLGKSASSALRPYCSKGRPVEVKNASSRRKIYGELIATPISEITQLEASCTVYNFEVEEDNSYLVDGLAVHNCRVKSDTCSLCGNEAPTRKEYCDHLKTQMLHVTDDGTVVGMFNNNPVLFDFSIVSVPADRLAMNLMHVNPSDYMQEKAASQDRNIQTSIDMEGEYSAMVYQQTVLNGRSDAAFLLQKYASLPESVKFAAIAAHPIKKATQRKTADIDKLIPLEPVAKGGLQEIYKNFRETGLGKLRQAEPEMSSRHIDELVDAMGGDSKTHSLLSTLAAHGVVLKPVEYQRLMLGKLGKKPERDAFDASHESLLEHTPKLHPDDAGSLNMDYRDINHGHAEALEDLIASKSYHRGGMLERVRSRLKEHEKHETPADEANESPEFQALEDALGTEEHERPENPLLSRVGGAYEDYAKKAMAFARQVAQAAEHIFGHGTKLTGRLGITPEGGSMGLPMVALGAPIKEAADAMEKIYGPLTADRIKAAAAALEKTAELPFPVIDGIILEKLS